MKNSRLAAATITLALILIGLATGRVLTAMQLADIRAIDSSQRSTSPPTPAAVTVGIPPHDVQGADIDALPRYPGATRVEYRRTVEDNLITTEVEYVTSAGQDDVRAFYRDIFRIHEWSVADLNFTHGEWTFFVLHGTREAFVEIEARGQLVEIEIELSEPHPEALTISPTPQATPTQVVTPTSVRTATPAPRLTMTPAQQATTTAAPDSPPQPTPTPAPPAPAPAQRPAPAPAPAPAPRPAPPPDDDNDDDNDD